MKKFIGKLRKEYQFYTKSRHLIVSQANDVLHLSKQAIFSLHRDQYDKAETVIFQAEKKILSLSDDLKKAPDLKYNGAYKAALEEYLEAKLFWQVLKFGSIKPVKEIKLNFDDYLAASCDLTGEMVRKMILFVTENKNDQAKELKELIAKILEELIKFDLTGYLRHKYDDAKRNLKKAEEIIYDLKIRK